MSQFSLCSAPKLQPNAAENETLTDPSSLSGLDGRSEKSLGRDHILPDLQRQ
ncbi:hypothetical protein [Iodobacter fluviatilis]|uniref:hypothetical protein n=1 Tax=Iodobacter fluviatilis TaxID=537 RepID=UPI00165E59E9|nr:hypothetical protein [Iodobacter fluviatilis]